MKKHHSVRHKKRSSSSSYLPLLIMGIVIVGILATFTLLNKRQDIRNRAAEPAKMLVRISKSYLKPTDEYFLYVYKREANGTITPHNDKLRVSISSCPLTGGNCSAWSAFAPWGTYQVINGQVKINITNAGSGQLKAKFKHITSDAYQESDPVTVTINSIPNPSPTSIPNLEKTADWWKMPTGAAKKFTGTNYTGSSNVTFNTWIGYNPETTITTVGTGQMMYFMKNKKEAYWGASVPWFGNSWGETKNLMWFLKPWQKLTDWHDTYLTSPGYEGYNNTNFSYPFLLKSSAFTSSNLSFSKKIISGNKLFPPYVLAPEYVSDGWGIFNENQVNGGNSLNKALSEANTFTCATDNNNCKAFWSAQANFMTEGEAGVDVPNYSDKILILSYYEFTDNVYKNNNVFGWREDWYFAKNIGLVKIQTKHFGPTQNGVTNSKLKLCKDDPDCISNVPMVSPHIMLAN